jgi:hypothetical protein
MTAQRADVHVTVSRKAERGRSTQAHCERTTHRPSLETRALRLIVAPAMQAACCRALLQRQRAKPLSIVLLHRLQIQMTTIHVKPRLSARVHAGEVRWLRGVAAGCVRVAHPSPARDGALAAPGRVALFQAAARGGMRGVARRGVPARTAAYPRQASASPFSVVPVPHLHSFLVPWRDKDSPGGSNKSLIVYISPARLCISLRSARGVIAQHDKTQWRGCL